MIPLSVPHLAGREAEYVRECLDTNWVSYVGPFVERFERELALKAGSRFAVAMSSGTSALHIALILAGVGPDDEVVMPALTFVAPANAVRYCGAWPVFTDVSDADWQWDISKLEHFLATECERRGGRLSNKSTGRRIAALLPVHLLGGMADVEAVAALATRYELPLIEDAAECLGATYKGRAIGAAIPGFSGPLRLVATSFNGNKIITTGGGGSVLCDDEKLAARAKHLSTTAKADRIEFMHDEVGYNYRLTNIAAALGVAQLEQLDGFVQRKRAIAERYAGELGTLAGVRVHPEPRNVRGTFWMYTIQTGRPARPLVDALISEGIQCRPLWVPMHRLPVFAKAARGGSLDCTEALYDQCVSLPCSVGLSDEDQARVVASVRRRVGTG